MEDLIEFMQNEVDCMIHSEEDLDDTDYREGIGILLSANQAKIIIDFYNEYNPNQNK